MTLYKYKAKDKEGKEYERTIEAQNHTDIYAVIRGEGSTLVSIHEASKARFLVSFVDIFGGIKTHQKITFAKNLGSMIEAGLSVTRALEVMGRQSRSKSFKKLISDLEEDVSHGKTLSDSMKEYPNVFSSLFISMVKAGEESGTVSVSLGMVASQMEKSYLLLKKVRGALIYPAVIISVMIVISILMLIFMVPTLTATFEGIGVKLPLATRILISSSNFLVEHTLLVFAVLVGLIASSAVFFKSVVGKSVVDSVSIRLPIIGQIIKEVQSARTARTLSSLLSAGVEIIMALDVTIDVLQNHLYKDALKRARTAIEKGESMSKEFGEYSHLYPSFVSEMVAVGEETGKISEMLVNAATYYENEVDQKTKDLSTIIEPVLMIIIGAGVGFFAISMLAPTYSLVDYI